MGKIGGKVRGFPISLWVAVVFILAGGAMAHAEVILPAADGHSLDAGFAGRFAVSDFGEGLKLRLNAFDDSVVEIDAAPGVFDVLPEMQILSWDDVRHELYYWKTYGSYYSIWAWRLGGKPQLVAWSYTQPAATMEGLGGGR
jgi:hypothetical protein